MKRFFAIAICMMLLATLVVSASAAGTAVEPAGWKPFGDIEINFNDDLSETIVFDGNDEDWIQLGVGSSDIDVSNLDSWAGNAIPDDATSRIPDDFAIHTYFAADSNYLYVAFNILDETVASVPMTDSSGAYGNCDAFQIQLDFNGIFANAAETDRAIFYSFGRREDGRMAVTVQHLDYAGEMVIWADDEINNVDSSGKPMVKGAVSERPGGWGAEFALSWQMLYEQAYDKKDKWSIDEELNLSFGPDSDFTLAAGVFYLNREIKEDNSVNLIFAAGTCSEFGILSGPDGENVGFYPEHCGIHLLVKADEDVTLGVDEIVTDPEDDVTDEETTKKTENKTEETTTVGEEATTAGEGGGDDAASKGCKGAIGIGVVAVAIVAIGAVAFKKKED